MVWGDVRCTVRRARVATDPDLFVPELASQARGGILQENPLDLDDLGDLERPVAHHRSRERRDVRCDEFCVGLPWTGRRCGVLSHGDGTGGCGQILDLRRAGGFRSESNHREARETAADPLVEPRDFRFGVGEVGSEKTREVDGGFIGDARRDGGRVGARDLGPPTSGNHLTIAWPPGTLLCTAGGPAGILRHGSSLSKTTNIHFYK